MKLLVSSQKHNNSANNGTGPAPGVASQCEKDLASQQQKQKSNSSVAAAVTADGNTVNNSGGINNDEDFDNDDLISTTSDDVNPPSCNLIFLCGLDDPLVYLCIKLFCIVNLAMFA